MAIIHSFKALCFCITFITFLAPFTPAEEFASGAGEPNDPNQGAVTIELTKLDVNDTTLELHYKIKNNTDHDVWICDNVNTLANPFEVFLAEDAQTLVIRKRLDVPSRAIWRTQPAGMYVRLCPGEDLIESLSLNLPVQPSFVFASAGRTQVTQNARCLALEIGFYDEDLPALICSIIIEADKFSGTTFDIDTAIVKEYFKGLLVKGCLGPLNSFEELNKDLINKGKVVIYYSYQALTGEKVLRIEVDNVSIPYEGYLQSTSNAESNNDPNNYEEKAVTIELNKLDVNDTNLELQYKIKNNTDHDVWICDNVNKIANPFEVFLAKDAQTFVLRKRLDVPSSIIWHTQPTGMYVRLGPGEDLFESLSLNLPVQSSFVFASAGRTRVTQNARCLTLEIGFYDEDLPGLILSIIQEADKISDLRSVAATAMTKEYFRGLLVRTRMGGLSNIIEAHSKGQVFIDYSWQALTGEKVLQIVVDGVSIPYEGAVQIESTCRI